MADVPGVAYTDVVYGPLNTVGGAGRFDNVLLTTDRKIIHAATGIPLYPNGFDVTPPRGQAINCRIPGVDQDGFVDAAGNQVKGWLYVLTGRMDFDKGGRSTFTREFQVTADQDRVDLDLVPEGRSVPGWTAPTAAVTSVAGLTGPVTAEQLAAELDGLVGGGTGGGVTPSPDLPGFFDFTGGALTPDPDLPGYFQIGA